MYRIATLAIITLLLAGCGRGDRSRTAKIWGIDISKHQSRVDWQRVVQKNPPSFVFLKATEGTLIVDPTFKRHSRQLDSLGVLWGAYHFFGHRTSGREQARSFIRTAKLKRGNMLPVLDIEQHRFMTDPRKSVREAKAFCKEIRNYYGINPIIYCSSRFYESYLKEDFPAGKYILWIADYNSDPDHLDWHLWQHTDSHRIEGIGGPVDRNVLDGDDEKLRKLILR